jgi:hypothetical protein
MDRPLLTVSDREIPMLRHAEGTAGEDQPWFSLVAMIASLTGG